MTLLAEAPADLRLRNGAPVADRRLSASEVGTFPVTLLGAVRDGQSVLVASDGISHQTDLRSEATEIQVTNKLYRLPSSGRIMWGYSGENGIGQALRVFLDESVFKDWQTLKDSCGAKLRELNVAAGQQHQPTSALFAGYLAAEMGLWVIDDAGDARSSDVSFCGWGRVSARVAWLSTETLSPLADRSERLATVMDSAIAEVGGLGPPLSLWRVGRDDIAKLR